MKTMFKRSGNELRPMRSMCSMASTLYRVFTTALMGGTASFEPVDVLASDAAVMVWGQFRGARNGQNFETNHAYYYRFDERGRFVEGHTVPGD